nr:hypothetical protein [Clostridium botulinum]
MKKKIVLVMCVITLLLFSACTSKENFNKKVGEEKKVVNKEEESQKKKENAFGKNNEEKEHNDILKEKKEDKSKENLKNKIIVIDPGHGSKSNLELERVSPDSEEKKIKDGGGADGVNSKTPEYLIAMDVASLKKLYKRKVILLL